MASLGTLMDHQEKTKHSISVSLFQSFVCHSFSSKKSLIHQTPSVSLVASFKSRSLYTKNTRSAADFFLPRSPRIAVQVLQASRVPYECTINPKNWDRKGITWDPQCQCSITKDHALNIPKPNFWIIFVKQISWSIYKTLNKPTVPLQSSAKHAGLWLPQPNKPHFQDAGRSSWRQSWGILTSFFVAKKKNSNERNPGSPPAVPRLVRSGIWTLNWSVSSMPWLQATKWLSKIKRREHQVGSKEISRVHSKPRHRKCLSNQWEYAKQSHKQCHGNCIWVTIWIDESTLQTSGRRVCC